MSKVEPKFLSAADAAIVAGRHVDTVREAARTGELCGAQSSAVSAVTGRRKRGAHWKFRPECVDAWVEGEPCAHQRGAQAPASLDAWRDRRGVG